MEQRDPFGRETDDNPLEEMGWSSGESNPPHAGPPEVAIPETPDQAAERRANVPPPVTREQLPGTGTPPPRPPDHRADYRPVPSMRQKRGISLGAMGCLIPVVILVFIVGIGAVVVSSVIDAVDDAVDDVVPTVPDVPGGDPGGGDAPQGLERRSLLLRGNLAPALRRLQRETESDQVRLIRIAAERVDVQVAISGGRTRLAQATYSGEIRVIATSPGGGGSTFPWSAINASAPRRIVERTTRGGSANRFDYLVLTEAAGLRWSAFLKNGRGFTAQADGRAVTPIG